MPAGDTCPVWISQAMRVVSTRVLPEPAPARIRALWDGSVTAANCSGLRLSRRFMRAIITSGRPRGGAVRSHLLNKYTVIQQAAHAVRLENRPSLTGCHRQPAACARPELRAIRGVER